MTSSPVEVAACCVPAPGRGLDAASAQRIAAVLKVIADPARLRLLSLIGGGETCVCELTEPLALSQPTVSHHLRVLVDAGLLEREQRGKWAYYRLVPESLDALDALVATVGRPRG